VHIRSIIAAAAMSSISSLAVAQTSPAPTAQSVAGMKMANSAGMAVRFVTVKPADFTSSKLVGAKVYNNQNESLGEIEDLVIDNGKTISGVVVSIGGFLGLGETYVLLDPSTIVLNQQDGKWRAYVDTSKDTLKNAPKFAYNKKSS
jgi:sporulation protein YlmC with PRC-barrel domain